MIRSIVTAIALVAVLAVPMTAAAHATITPKALAWQVKDLSNKNLKFGGSPYRVTSVNCLAHGGGMFVCRASLNDGSGYYWPTVTVKNGSLKLSGGMAL